MRQSYDVVGCAASEGVTNHWYMFSGDEVVPLCCGGLHGMQDVLASVDMVLHVGSWSFHVETELRPVRRRCI